jgi:hypothetical protein
MTPINPNWTRWIVAGITKHFHNTIQVEQGLQTIDAGIAFNMGTREDAHCEVRIDGPRFKEISKGYFNAYVEVNIFISINMDKHNMYKMPTVMGIVQNAMSQIITIYRVGNGPADDGTKVCCLTLIDNNNPKEAVETNNFGQIDPNVHLHQAAIEAHYEMEGDFINPC